MYGRETVAARQLLGTCFLLRDTTPINDTINKMGCLLKVPPNKDSKTLVLV